MEAEVFSMGSWKNLIEMEETLTLEELYLLYDAMYKKEHRANKFQAAMQGVDLDEDPNDKSLFDEVYLKAQSELTGKSEQAIKFDFMGIEIEDDDEDY